MSANIFGKHFAERDGHAWWGGAERLEDTDGKATSAVVRAGLGFAVHTEPLYYRRDGVEYRSDNVAIVRPGIEKDETAWVQLGVASPEYTPITNYGVARLIDPLTDGSADPTIAWKTTTVGGLGRRGEQFFITLDAGTATIAGDEMRQFFFIHNSHDGSGALYVRFTPVRVVCQNTVILGAQRANVTLTVVHTRNVEAETKFAIDMAVKLQRAQQAGMEELAQFPKVRLSADDVRAVLRATYPDRERNEGVAELVRAAESKEIELDDARLGRLYGKVLATETERAKAARLRLAAYERFLAFNADRPNFAYTAWALLGAITETESHREGGNDLSIKRSIVSSAGARNRNMAAGYAALASLIPASR